LSFSLNPGAIGRAIALGIEILSDVEQVIAGFTTSFSFSWHGKVFNVTLDQGQPVTPGGPPPVPPPGKP
jgi:hypothetical protein